MRKAARRRLGLLLLAAPLAVAPLVSQESGRSASDGSVDREIVAGLASGRNVESLLAEVRQGLHPEEPRASRSVLPPAPTEAVELNEALAGLSRALGRHGEPPSQAGMEPASQTLGTVLGAYDRLQAADSRYRERFADAARRLDAIGAASEIHARLQRAKEAYDERMRSLLLPMAGEMERLREALSADGSSAEGLQAASAATVSSLAAAREALADLPPEPAPEILRAAVLPYGRASLGQRAPTTSATIVPSYLDISDAGGTTEDLAGSPLAPLSESILGKAEEIGYDYVRIFEFVRNEIETEWYAGAMKGADETLRQGRGSSADQAALLVALLRASGAPARFVTGVAELPLTALADDLGFVDGDDLAARVPEALRRAGVPHRPVVRGGRVVAFEVELVWVAARIPYANYRGAIVDVSGATWIPLAPSVKTHRVQPAAGVLEEMESSAGFSVDEFVEEILATTQVSDPLTLLRTRVSDHLAATEAGSYDDALRSRSLEPQTLGLLPSTLPFRVVAVTAEGPRLTESLVHGVRFVVRAGVSESSPVALDWTVPLTELAGHRVTLSYLPATVDDHRTVNAFGGLHSVPLYLVRLRPQLKVDGRPRAVGQEPLEAGVQHRLELGLVSPFGEESVARSLMSGGYYALDLSAQEARLREVPADATADSETLGAALLARVAGSYAEAWGEVESELADLMGVALVRPLPSVAIAAGAVEVEEVFGLPEQLRWEGVSLDAALRVAEPVAGMTTQGPPAPGTAASWLRLAALQGSALEHRVFEELFLVDGISADKGLGLARETGIEILHVTPSNLSEQLPRLQHPAVVKGDIESWVRLGMEVDVPLAPISRNAWRGAVWKVVDPEGRGAGYFIAGGLAGGATTVPPPNWVLQFLADALAAPYSPEPGDDPLAGVEVAKIPTTDGQKGPVGEVYGESLAVLVRDARGLPVKDALVRFEVWSGGGALLDGEGREVQSLVTTTSVLGIASAPFRSGIDTADEPVYVQRSADDLHATRALVNLVEVAVDSHLGPLVPSAPFELLAFPGPPEVLRRNSPTEDVHRGWPGVWAGSLQVAVEDEHGNPVSNVDVTFSVTDRVFEASCPSPSEFLPSVVFDECAVEVPRLGDCGSPSVTVPTSVFGASAGVILGDTVLTLHTVTAAAEDLPPVNQQYLAQTFVAAPPLHCKTLPGTLHAEVVVPVDQEGRNIAAARAGSSMEQPLDFVLYYARPKSNDPESPDYSRLEWVPTNGDVNLTVDNGGAASPVLGLDQGRFQSTITTGPIAGVNTVTLEASNVETITLSDGQIVPDVRGMEPRPLTTVWGVLPHVLGVTPDPPVLGPTGQTTSEVVIGYEIEPSEYRSASAEVILYEEGEVQGVSIASSLEGPGTASVQRGFAFDVERSYELELLLNRGSSVEIRSDRFTMPLFQKLLRNVSPSIQLDRDVDLLNQRSCEVGSEFRYTLSQPATVTLEMRPVESLETDGSRVLGPPIVLIDAEERAEGEQLEVITSGDLAAGDYEFTLRAVALSDGQTDEETGTARSELRVRDSLPVGHTLVHGVDLWDGHLVVSREDLTYPGRGAALSFVRTYSSNAGAEPGALGVGWSHTYESRVVVTPCGEAIVIGGEGSGMRFVDDGDGGLRPLKGYHGTLIANEAELSFDFYAKGGNRYRYDLAHGREFRLGSIADPNGNTTRLVYETGPTGEPRLAAVVDPAGRTLVLRYRSAEFAFWRGEVLERVEGPEESGQVVSFTYDGFGNLIRAEREGPRAESYAYATRLGDSLEDRHALLSVTDLLDGATSSYQFQRAPVRATADVVVPSLVYTRIVHPEGGVTRFEYDLAGLESRGPPELVTRVTDRRNQTTTHFLNQYGSSLRIVDPLGHETQMTWATDDVVMTSRTDANGIETTFGYDEHGNLLNETVSFEDPREGAVSLTRSFTYHPPEGFDPPYVKERVATRSDRTGATTSFAYDSHGNLLESRISVTNADAGVSEVVTTHTYTARGDRASTTDPRGEVTRFTYDTYGNVASVTDPEGGTISTAFDVRSLPIRQTDPLGRLTVLEYDSLGRLVRRVLPKVEGEVAAPQETWAYDDAANTTTRTDAAGRSTVTFEDLEGRVIGVANAAGGVKLFDYDAEGNKILETGWHDDSTPSADTAFTYDAAGRQTERREPLGRTTTYSHDPVGNLVREELSDRDDPGFTGRVIEHEYDGLNRRVETSRLTETSPIMTRMAYDGEGRLVRQEDPLERVATTEYDALGRAIRSRGPEGSETVRLYDGVGNLVEERRLNEVEGARADQIRTFAYDGAGRLVERADALGHATLFEYDLAGNRLREIDRRLNVTFHTYDARNRRVSTTVHLTRVSNPQRQVTTHFAYDPVGNLIEERPPNGNVVEHTYDALDRKLASADFLGPLEAATYDARGNVLTATDANGNVTTTVYDALDRPIRIERPEDRVTELVYDVAANQIAETDARGNTTTFKYDRLDRLVRITDPEPFRYTVDRQYDAVGNLVAETDRRGNTTTFEYDGLDRLVRRVAPAPLAYESLFTYDRVGNQLSATDPRGILTETRYDLENRPVEVRRAGQLTQEIEYDAEGNRRFVTDAKGNTTGFEYDERNLLLAENGPLASITRHTLNDMGDAAATRDPEGRVTSYGYDLRRRLVAETNHASETTSYAYDGNGNRTSMTRPEENTWLYRYDGADRLVEVEDPDGGETSYTWDRNGNRLSQSDANLHTTSFEYDELDRLVATIYPDETTRETYTYDENGNRTGQVDPKGQTMAWEYDVLDRETARIYGLPTDPTGDDLASIATDYDPNGNPTRITETYTGATGTRMTNRTYDLFDRLETVTDPLGERLAYVYDANGNRVRLTDPDERVTSYTFDALNRPTAVTTQAGVTEYRYYRDSRLHEVRYPNGTTAAHTYDAAGRTATIENRLGATLVSRYAYEYDDNGNRVRQLETNGGAEEETTYAYDSLDRLIEVPYPDRTVTYGYDAVGNRTSEQATDPDTGSLLVDKLFDYDDRNRLLSVTDSLAPDGAVTYGYDANGNQTSRSTATTTTIFRFDTRDRLVEVREDGNLLGTYLYDYQGLRVAKRVGTGETLRYVYDDQSVLLQTDSAGLTLAKYEYGPDRLLSLDHQDEGRSFYLFDALGSVVDLTGEDGGVEARYQWDAWGNSRVTAGDSWNPFGFTGHERDEETGLYYAKARFYDPDVGRFLTEDPFGGFAEQPPSLHRYLYAYQNPTVYVDLDGRESSVAIQLNQEIEAVLEGEMSREEFQERIQTRGKGTLIALSLVLPGPEDVALGLAAKTRLGGSILSKVGSALGRVFGRGGDEIVEGTQEIAEVSTRQARKADAPEGPGPPPPKRQARVLEESAEGNLTSRGVDEPPGDYTQFLPEGKNRTRRQLSDRRPGRSGGSAHGGDEHQVVKNRREGVRREVETEAELKTQHPDASVQRQQTLRDCEGCKVADPLTGEGRVLDHVVIRGGRAVDAVETTSPTAYKAAQVAKEERVREAGGTFVRDRETGELVDFKDLETRIKRRD